MQQPAYAFAEKAYTETTIDLMMQSNIYNLYFLQWSGFSDVTRRSERIICFEALVFCLIF